MIDALRGRAVTEKPLPRFFKDQKGQRAPPQAQGVANLYMRKDGAPEVLV